MSDRRREWKAHAEVADLFFGEAGDEAGSVADFDGQNPIAANQAQQLFKGIFRIYSYIQ